MFASAVWWRDEDQKVTEACPQVPQGVWCYWGRGATSRQAHAQGPNQRLYLPLLLPIEFLCSSMLCWCRLVQALGSPLTTNA